MARPPWLGARLGTPEQPPPAQAAKGRGGPPLTPRSYGLGSEQRRATVDGGMGGGTSLKDVAERWGKPQLAGCERGQRQRQRWILLGLLRQGGRHALGQSEATNILPGCAYRDVGVDALASSD